MTTSLLDFSNHLADAVSAVAPSVVQIQGRKSPASGVVFAPGAVVTTVRALGREEGLRVRTDDGQTLDAELAGWDPTTHLAVLRVSGLDAPAAKVAGQPARVGHLALAVGRSWSSTLTASAGIVAIIGGPLPTGRGRSIERVIRTTAPMHRGFTGGAFVDVSGALVGIVTAAEIRGLRVIIPAEIALKAAGEVLEYGQARRGYLGVAGQQVSLTRSQSEAAGNESGVLVLGVVPDSPADRSGLLIGDVLLAFAGSAVTSPDALLEQLASHGAGGQASVGILRGTSKLDIPVTLGETRRRA
jgi:S1-C subfamily serine protease